MDLSKCLHVYLFLIYNLFFIRCFSFFIYLLASFEFVSLFAQKFRLKDEIVDLRFRKRSSWNNLRDLYFPVSNLISIERLAEIFNNNNAILCAQFPLLLILITLKLSADGC